MELLQEEAFPHSSCSTDFANDQTKALLAHRKHGGKYRKPLLSTATAVKGFYMAQSANHIASAS